MINLLLPIDRKAVRTEYHRRLFVVGGLLTFGLALIALVVLSSFAFVLSLRRGEVAEQIAGVKQQFSVEDLTKAGKDIGQINSAIKIFAATAPHEPITDILKKIIDKRSAGIQLTSLKFTTQGDSSVTVSGKSQTRVALLDYLEDLRAEPRFLKVESPVKNIIREKDIAFNLTITMAPLK